MHICSLISLVNNICSIDNGLSASIHKKVFLIEAKLKYNPNKRYYIIRAKKSLRERKWKQRALVLGRTIGVVRYHAPMIFYGHHRECCLRWCPSKPPEGSFVPFVCLFAALYGFFHWPLVGWFVAGVGRFAVVLSFLVDLGSTEVSFFVPFVGQGVLFLAGQRG